MVLPMLIRRLPEEERYALSRKCEEFENGYITEHGGNLFEGVEEIETVALDDVLEGKRITFIKMDIEGAEYEALLGARKLIEINRPRMAISVYHKYEDFVTLADLVLKMHPDYRISFRHYGFDELETVMYVE